MSKRELPLVRDCFSFPVCDMDVSGESVTKQSFKDESDINILMSRFERTGVPPEIPGRIANFLDVTGFTNYHDAMNQVVRANEAFMCLDAEIRSKFDNDPGKFLDFVDNPENRDECVKLGIFEEVVEKSPTMSSLDVNGGTDTASVS